MATLKNPVGARSRQGEKAYLTERALGRFLRERLDPHVFASVKVPGIAQRFRPDYRSEPYKIIAEFDGPQHYQSARHVILDAERDRILTAAGYQVVRIPYFVQLAEPIISLLFGDRIKDRSSFKEFPQGFIDPRVVYPADFCELGIGRFLADLERFAPIRADIEQSLDAAVRTQGDWRIVYPPSLYRAPKRALRGRTVEVGEKHRQP